jgi:hypothetical protein
MQIINMKMPATKRVVPVNAKRESKYDFSVLTPGSDEAISITNLATADDAVKAATRLSSAAAQYRKRTGSKAKFAVRKGQADDGTFWAAAWKVSNGLDGDGTTTVDGQVVDANGQVDPSLNTSDATDGSLPADAQAA